MNSIFMDKTQVPNEKALQIALDHTYLIWKNLETFTLEQFPKAQKEWKYSGEKTGWSFRLRDKKRVILYLLPRDKFFKVAFVFGQKAYEAVQASLVSNAIKQESQAAKAYVEGRGIRIEMKDHSKEQDIMELIRIKLAH